jgi:hypothetical protein
MCLLRQTFAREDRADPHQFHWGAGSGREPPSRLLTEASFCVFGQFEKADEPRIFVP